MPIRQAGKIELDRITALLESQQWIFAKTMPENPHYYTLRKNWTDDAQFVEVVQFIRDYGEIVTFRRWEYTVLDTNGYRYWTMGAPLPETILINRRSLDE